MTNIAWITLTEEFWWILFVITRLAVLEKTKPIQYEETIYNTIKMEKNHKSTDIFQQQNGLKKMNWAMSKGLRDR